MASYWRRYYGDKDRWAIIGCIGTHTEREILGECERQRTVKKQIKYGAIADRKTLKHSPLYVLDMSHLITFNLYLPALERTEYYLICTLFRGVLQKSYYGCIGSMYFREQTNRVLCVL